MRNQTHLRGLTLRPNLVYAAVLAVGAMLMPGAASAESIVTYRGHIFPILQNKCMECHKHGGQGQVASGLDMSSYATLMRGTRFGAVIVPGDPLTSNLSVLVEGRAHESIRMPFQSEKLSGNEIRMINSWIKQGAHNN